MLCNKVTKLSLVMALSLHSILGCSDDTYKIVTTCEEKETYLNIKQTLDGEFYRAINIDSSGGASFRGFDYVDSATDLRLSTRIFIGDTKSLILFKSRKNERSLQNVGKECRETFRSFIQKHDLTELLETKT